MDVTLFGVLTEFNLHRVHLNSLEGKLPPEIELEVNTNFKIGIDEISKKTYKIAVTIKARGSDKEKNTILECEAEGVGTYVCEKPFATTALNEVKRSARTQGMLQIYPNVRSQIIELLSKRGVSAVDFPLEITFSDHIPKQAVAKRSKPKAARSAIKKTGLKRKATAKRATKKTGLKRKVTAKKASH